jgi:hypothetical protein
MISVSTSEYPALLEGAFEQVPERTLWTSNWKDWFGIPSRETVCQGRLLTAGACSTA